ncbi:MAG: hypothetical protein ACI97A_001344 [Planctomycetota bacterium]
MGLFLKPKIDDFRKITSLSISRRPNRCQQETEKIMTITKHFQLFSSLIVGAMIFLSQGATPEPGVSHMNESFLGATQARVFRELGVPARIDSGIQGSVSFYYKQCDPALSNPTIRLHGGVVIWVSPKAKLSFKKINQPSEGAYLGQDAKQLVARLGQASKFFEGQSSTQLVYKSGLQVNLNHGMVIGISTSK